MEGLPGPRPKVLSRCTHSVVGLQSHQERLAYVEPGNLGRTPKVPTRCGGDVVRTDFVRLGQQSVRPHVRAPACTGAGVLVKSLPLADPHPILAVSSADSGQAWRASPKPMHTGMSA
jgi:hypothetical protein